MKTVNLLSIIFLILQIRSGLSQTTFEKLYNDTNLTSYSFINIDKTNDEGFIFVSPTAISKIDSTGVIVWSTTLNTTPRSIVFRGLLALADGGFLVTGQIEDSIPSNYNFLVIRGDKNGQILWSHSFDYSISETCDKAIETMDHGFLIAGALSGGFNQGVFLFKLDSLGNVVFMKKYQMYASYVFDFKERSDGNIILITGYSLTSQIFMIDSMGNILEKYIFGSSFQPYNFLILKNNSLILVGHTMEAYGSFNLANFAMLKLDSTFQPIWMKTKVLTDTEQVQPYKIILASNNKFVVCSGFTYNPSSSIMTIYLTATDSSGHFLWTKKYPGFTYFGGKVFETGDGGLVTISQFGALFYNQTLIIKTDSLGNANCDDSVSNWTEKPDSVSISQSSVVDTLQSLVQSTVIYTSSSSISVQDFCNLLAIQPTEHSSKLNFYPNPLSSNATLDISNLNQPDDLIIKVYNSFGLLVKEYNVDHLPFRFEREELKLGVYFMSVLENNLLLETIKLLIIE